VLIVSQSNAARSPGRKIQDSENDAMSSGHAHLLAERAMGADIPRERAVCSMPRSIVAVAQQT
jgi:hypothetical protein